MNNSHILEDLARILHKRMYNKQFLLYPERVGELKIYNDISYLVIALFDHAQKTLLGELVCLLAFNWGRTDDVNIQNAMLDIVSWLKFPKSLRVRHYTKQLIWLGKTYKNYDFKHDEINDLYMNYVRLKKKLKKY